ncbi:gliding motility-associated-like protein [Filimonas zeae]|uniref:T9SS type B sorting domain-containing protein n=1 Tax=Filimonas zeae TaxID=1737353 RepID=UPI00166CBE2E|nr:gliding motility-associated C-terminal domain-containing protein [Filimonas zeae]MDR6339065.1 gliding motility-associated-like protein [Filimonas zeae]
MRKIFASSLCKRTLLSVCTLAITHFVHAQCSGVPAVHGTFVIDNRVPTNVTTGTFHSFNDAYNHIKCGIDGPVVFNVAAGSAVYTEQLIMDAVAGTSAVNTITFNGNNNVISYTATDATQRAVIRLYGTDFTRFHQLTIKAGGTGDSEYGYAVQLGNDADDNIFSGCSMEVSQSSPLDSYTGVLIAGGNDIWDMGDAGCDRNQLLNNTITGGNMGIAITSTATDANTANIIKGNTIRDFYNYGVYAGTGNNVLVDSNNISRPARTDVADGYGVYVTGTQTGSTVSRNRVHHLFAGMAAGSDGLSAYGVYYDFAELNGDNRVANNLFYGFDCAGNAYGVYNNFTGNLLIAHNTIALDGASASGGNLAAGIYLLSVLTDVTVVNNIVAVSRSGGGKKYALYQSNRSDGIVTGYNDYYIMPAAVNAFTGYYAGADVATLADWKTASGNDARSLAADPLFTDAVAGNFLPVSAALDNKGFFLKVNTDITGAARSSTTPDMGAYEFVPVACPATLTAGNTQVYGAPACAGASIGLSLKGYNPGSAITYQWQYAATETGTYANLGNVLTNSADTVIKAASVLYYRVQLSCNSNTVWSAPVLVNINAALPADTYTIDKNAAPGAPKTFHSFNDARMAMACGIAGPVVFNVTAGSGVYEEQLVLDSVPGASAVNTITFKGNGNTIHYSSSDAQNKAVIKLVKADYIILDSLVVDADGSGSYGYGIQLYDGADYNTVKGCTIIANTSSINGRNRTNHAGIVVSNDETSFNGFGEGVPSTGNVFTRDSIVGGVYGVVIAAGDGLAVNNTISNCIMEDGYSGGIRVSYATGTIISGNRLSRPHSSNLADYEGVSVDMNDHVQITGNLIRDVYMGAPANYSNAIGIMVQNSAPNTSNTASLVANNVIYLTETSGSMQGIYATYSGNTNYYHNTIILDNSSTDAGGDMQGTFFEGTENIQFKNNIVSVTSAGGSAKTAFYINSGLVTADRNNYYVNKIAPASIANYLGVSMLTLAEWKAAAGQDAGSVSFDPAFANPAAGDFTPARGQIDNIGTPLGITHDITGAVRSTTTPDAGAVEFAVAPCNGAPVAGTVVLSPAGGVCLGSTISMQLNGNSNGGYYLFQWQSARAATGEWTTISDFITQPDFSTEVNWNTWFRCRVICGADTVATTPVQLQLNAVMPKGIYTINPALPSSYPPGLGANFQSVTEAVTALQCGIGGAITFNIAPGTYTEQVTIPRIPGASDTSRVTFRGVAGNAASVKIEYTGTFDDNHVIRLDNASYVTFTDVSITSLAGPYGRVVVLANNSGADSILNSVLTAPAVTSGNAGGVYAEKLSGRGDVIKNNTITGGRYGVYLEGKEYGAFASSHVVEDNRISGFYTNGVYATYPTHLVVGNNQILLKGTMAATACGISTDGADSAMQILHNTITIENTTSTIRGMLFTYGYMESAGWHQIAGNTITAINNNTGRVHGINLNAVQTARLINNVININTTGTEAYGISLSTGSYQLYNNTVQNMSAGTGTANAVLFASASIGLECVTRNNIFRHTGGGAVMRAWEPSFVNSDYNTLYTTGAVLFRTGSSGAVTYNTFQAWRDATTWDYNSLYYQPALVSTTDLHPKTDAPEVWAIHGRGVQIAGNNKDINNQPRPDILTAGVPDMGAYEFMPAALPVVLTATPAVPVANSNQLLMLGTDTVARIRWGASVPATVTARRYSGIVPPSLPADAKYMYFYTDINTGGGNYAYDIDHYYIDSWQGFVPKQKYIRLAKTDAAGAWSLSGKGTVNEGDNILYDKDLTSLHLFTGLFDSVARAQEPPVVVAAADTTNLGTRFWTSYPLNDFGSYGTHAMVLYLSAADTDADVTVKIHGTTWVRNYHVPAGTVVMTDAIPRSGSADARLLASGVYDRGISIVSTQPIAAHTYTYTSSGGSMLLPVGAYGYDYQALIYKQVGSPGSAHSFVNVIAEYDSTMIEITPSVPAVGHPANVPFTVLLHQGQVFQLLGEFVATGDARGYDLSGTRIRSIKNEHGKCYPSAVFSGSSGTSISCKDEAGNTGNFIYQQNLPYQAWGKTYLTVPTYSGEISRKVKNIYRISVKEPATGVKVNGNPLSISLLVNNSYYEIESTEMNYIEADKPVMVAQYMPSIGNCGTDWGYNDGGPEMIYLTPADQGIKQALFFRNNQGDIVSNYAVVVVPDAGVASLRIDGRTNFDETYPHSMPGYTVVVKRWDAERIQSAITCDTTFSGITYGVGQNESYGYNLGISRIRALITGSTITKTLGVPGNTGNTTCARAPVRFYVSSSLKPASIEWKFSKVEGLNPHADSLQTIPVPVDSAVVNGRWMYRYSVNDDFRFTTPGTYYVPVVLRGTDISSCDNALDLFIRVVVTPAPEATAFTVSFPGCAKQEAAFSASATTNTGETVKAWKWAISNGLGYTTQQFTRVFDTAGTYTVQLQMITSEGCVVDSAKQVTVKPLPVIALAEDTVIVCPGTTDVQFAVTNPVSGTVYNWYTSESGSTPATTGATASFSNVTANTIWYADAVADGCTSTPRVKAVALIAVTPDAPVVTVDSAGLNVLRFAWLPVTNAVYYKVSVDNGVTWIDPSSGPAGLTHTIAGLVPGTSVNILVRAFNQNGCVYKEGSKQGAARSGKLFLPNSFTPNGDGLNDLFHVQGGEGVRQFRLLVFNQWGEKVFETSDPGSGWNGMYKGRLQPSGVYIYICTAVMADTGEKTEKKGSLNLIR